MNTIRELIEALSAIEDQDQPYLGNVYVAEDFEIGDNRPSYSQLLAVKELRAYEKSMGYLGQELTDLVFEQMESEEN